MKGWIRLDNDFPIHDKTRSVSKDARLLQVTACCWSSRNESNGRIPKNMLAVILAEAEAKAASVKQLLEAEFWHDRGDHYEIHNYLKRNRSKEQLEAERDRWRRSKGIKTVSREEMSAETREEEPEVPRARQTDGLTLGSVQDDRQTVTAEQVVVAASKLEAKRKGHGPNYAFGVAKNLREERLDDIETMTASYPQASLDELACWALDGVPRLAVVKREPSDEIKRTIEAEEAKALA